MRKLILIMAIAVAVAIGFSLSTLRATISRGAEALAAAVADGTSGNVEIGDVALSVFPLPSAAINGIAVRTAERRNASSQPILEIPLLRVRPKFFPLLVGRVVVDRVEAVDAVLYVRREAGAVHFESFLPENGPTKLRELAYPVEFVDATLHYRDAGRPQSVSADVEDLDVLVGGRRDSATIDIVGTGRPLGSGSLAQFRLQFEEGAGPSGGDRIEGTIELTAGDVERIKSALPLLTDIPLRGTTDMEIEVTGFAGEKNTEAAPAAPLLIAAKGTADFELLGRTEKLDFDTIVAIDDRSVQLKKGDLAWAGLEGSAGGWMTSPGRKLSGRMTFENVDIAALMGEWGIDPDWHPELVISGKLKLGGHELEPLLTYEASADSVRFDPYDGYEVSAGPTSFRGSLLASNAVFSISASPQDLKIGALDLESTSIGCRYFRDKLTVTALDVAVWEGKSYSSIVYVPKDHKNAEVGGMVEEAEADAFIEDMFPELGLEISGAMNAIAEGGFDADAPWSMGRIGFYDGKIGPVGIVNAALTAIARDSGATGLIDGELIAKFPNTLAPDAVDYDQIEMDYQTRADGIALRTIKAVLPQAGLVAEGLIETDRTFGGWGVVTLSAALTSELALRVAAIADLAGSDGRLRLPVKLQGGTSGAAVTVDERFVSELTRALRGESVGSFVATEPQSELVMDIPSLREQFERW